MIELLYPPTPAPIVPSIKAGDPREPVHAEEMLPVVTASGLVTGQMRRSYAHGGSKLLHPVVHLHVINRSGELYLQRRSLLKRTFPGFWDTAVGGHVGYGEYPQESLYREAAEEIGLYDFNPVFLDSYLFENEREKELIFAWAAVGDFDIDPDSTEVLEGRWWTEKEILDASGKDILTPQFEQEYLRFARALQALL